MTHRISQTILQLIIIKNYHHNYLKKLNTYSTTNGIYYTCILSLFPCILYITFLNFLMRIILVQEIATNRDRYAIEFI